MTLSNKMSFHSTILHRRHFNFQSIVNQWVNEKGACKTAMAKAGLFFFISTGATWYYHATCIEFSYFELFTDYEDDILKVISNRHIQLEMWGSKFD